MKKIALFIGEVTSEFQTEVVKGVNEAAGENDMQCFIFTNSGVYGGTILYAYGEKNVITIPYLEDYDGIIVAEDTFSIEGMCEDVARLLEKEAHCPVVCIRQKDDRFYNVLVDDYSAMSEMVEHFIVHHGFKRISFMTGRLEMEDAQRRLLAYIDIMQKYGLKVTPEMIFEGDYWRSKGKEAVEWFLQGDEKPEAIVCANDYMAISVCNALYEKGYQIPEDICVSGYDDVDEAKYAVPSISSMHVSGCLMGKEAVRIIKEVLEGGNPPQNVYVEVEPGYRESCGCSCSTHRSGPKELFKQKEAQQKILYHSSVMRIALDNQDDFEGLVMISNLYICNFAKLSIYLCFCDEAGGFQKSTELNQSYTEKMHLRAIYENHESKIMDEVFMRRDILPEGYLEEGENIFVFPFHEKHNCLGYVVLKTDEIERLHYIFSAWIQAMAAAVERQRMYRLSKDLQALQENYNRDALTGIGNRRKAETVMNQYRQKSLAKKGDFCVVSLDMDGLKEVNDKYGHLEGDSALCALANILVEVVGDMGCATRIGGDEYLLCLDMDSEEQVQKLIATIREKLVEFNGISGRDWKLDASIGYAFCRQGSTILFAMQQADKNMYQEKRGKKSNRLSQSVDGGSNE